jgi:hypothetical protein
MAKRTLLALLVAMGALAVAPMAHAGRDTVPNTTSVLPPAANVALTTPFSAPSVNSIGSTIRSVLAAVSTGTATQTANADGSVTVAAPSGGGSITVNANGSVTIVTTGGGSVTVASAFLASIISAYL